MKKAIFLNGKFISPKNFKVSILDSGLFYGQGVFETMRSYDGRVFALDKHLHRLLKSLPAVKIKCPYSAKELARAINKVLRLNNFKDAYIRLTVWQGEKRANTLIFVKNFPSYYKKGFRGLIADYPVNEKSPLAGIKSTNYLLFHLARKNAEEKGFDEALFLNTKGFLAEGSRSNIFFVKNGQIFTPALKCGCLPGITRGIVISLARSLEIPVKEEKLRAERLFGCEEAFLTSSLMEIMPLAKVNNKVINKGKAGQITTWLQEEYKKKVESYVEA